MPCRAPHEPHRRARGGDQRALAGAGARGVERGAELESCGAGDHDRRQLERAVARGERVERNRETDLREIARHRADHDAVGREVVDGADAEQRAPRRRSGSLCARCSRRSSRTWRSRIRAAHAQAPVRGVVHLVESARSAPARARSTRNPEGTAAPRPCARNGPKKSAAAAKTKRPSSRTALREAAPHEFQSALPPSAARAVQQVVAAQRQRIQAVHRDPGCTGGRGRARDAGTGAGSAPARRHRQ